MKILTHILAIVSLALLTGCGEQKVKPQSAPIKLAGMYWPGAYWIDVANEKGFFRDAGLDVSVVNVDADYIGSYDLLLQGKLDSVPLPFFDFVRLNAEGHPLLAVIVTDYSSGAEGVVARPGIASFKDLKGKRIGLKRNSYAEYIFTVVADRNQMVPQDFELIDMQAEAVADEFVKGNVDAIFAWEPLQSQALEHVPGSKIVFSTSEIPGIAGGVQCFPKDFVITRREEVKRLVEVWARSTEYIQTNPKEAFAIVAKIYNRPVEEVAEFLKADQILSPRQNQLAFSFAAGFDSIHGAARQMNDFMLDRGMTKNRLDTSTIVDPSFVKGLGENGL